MIRKHDVYIASYIKTDVDDFGNQTTTYDTPFQITDITLNSLSGSTEIAMFGDKISQMCRTLLDYDGWIDKIKANDVAYLYTATPKGEQKHGEKANYRVKSALPQNKKIAVYFERL